MLQNYQKLTVRQEVEMLQGLHRIRDQELLSHPGPRWPRRAYAYEESGTLSRLFLQSNRPLICT